MIKNKKVGYKNTAYTTTEVNHLTPRLLTFWESLQSTKAPTLLIEKIIHFSLETEEIGIHNPVFPANLPCCLLLVACPPFCLFQPLQLLQRLSGSLIQEQSESSSNRSLSSKENLSFSFSQSNIKSIISARLRSSSLNDSELFVPSAALRQRF